MAAAGRLCLSPSNQYALPHAGGMPDRSAAGCMQCDEAMSPREAPGCSGAPLALPKRRGRACPRSWAEQQLQPEDASRLRPELNRSELERAAAVPVPIPSCIDSDDCSDDGSGLLGERDRDGMPGWLLEAEQFLGTA